jgi:hypothetical protein
MLLTVGPVRAVVSGTPRSVSCGPDVPMLACVGRGQSSVAGEVSARGHRRPHRAGGTEQTSRRQECLQVTLRSPEKGRTQLAF